VPRGQLGSSSAMTGSSSSRRPELSQNLGQTT
jgi:hypothetical protein